MTEKETLFKETLAINKERITSPRLQIFRAILRKGPILTTGLAEAMSQDGINVSTTYRTLQLFRDLEITIDFSLGDRKLVELSHDFVQHHHHLWCKRCGRLIDFDNVGIEASIVHAAQSRGFRMTGHKLEISGVCAGCAKLRNAPRAG